MTLPLKEPAMATGWQPIKTAPKDGTVVRVRNEQTAKSGMVLDAKWGKYQPISGPKIKAWVVVKDHSKFMPVRPGSWVIPTEWSSPSRPMRSKLP